VAALCDSVSFVPFVSSMIRSTVAHVDLAALQANFRRHVRIARWTLPIWLYVSVTGVLVYWMLYRL